SDVLLTAGDTAYLFNGTKVVNGASLTANDASMRLTRDFEGAALNAHAVAAGDVNGDGLEDLLLADTSINVDNSQAYLLVGRPTTALGPTMSLVFNSDAIFPVGFVDGAAYRLGDLNHDGYDDFAVSRTREVDGPNQGSLFIYFGSASYTIGTGAVTKGPEAA